jgi:signal transduction histidine kinase
LDLAANLSDGVFCFQKSELITLNPAAKKMIDADSSLLPRVMEVLRSGFEASVEVIFPDGIQRGSYILRRAHLLDSSGIVIAQDVTRIREAEKAKTHFLGLLSHEIRTPVTSLVLAIRILERGSNAFDNTIHQKLIATCSKDVERLRELLDDLLSISRFESITQSCPVSLSLRNSDLKRILRNAEESFRAEAVDRGIRLESQVVENSISQAVSGAAWTSEVDAAKLGWALSNLINHAVRQTSRGGEVRVSLRRSQSADGRRFFEYRVQDSGNGIPPDQMNRIMEPYSGVYDLRVARTELTGSSLSIARQVAEAHGGSLRVCSAPGQGSEFQLRFPSKERSQDGKVACG